MSGHSRRDVLRVGGGISLAGLAGCTGFLPTTDDEPGDPSTEPTPAYPSVLTRPLPNPERHVDESRGRADYAREVGTVRIDSEGGTLSVHGPGSHRDADEIVTVAGYLDADGIEAGDTWGGVVDPARKYVGTNVTWNVDRLSFDRGTFRGVALRGVSGVTLVVDGETVATDRGTVRYTSAAGVRIEA